MTNQQFRPNLLDLPISFFEYDHKRKAFANFPASITTLRRIALTNYYQPITEAINNEPDKTAQGELKKQLPATTPASLLRHRKKDTPFHE
ncbi:hypothetical protein [Spirosoma endophyticum]|uniref:Uncharacterized protein n=1 Tax=Spirosoma endophyticum TaxID=662367 RepID=A0A1I2G3X9_9BACT|nr:hypothetical protein [Spirosoma endophyticum]SFF11839.1 hypothetical protein SAMN05216167_12942 [Spirosoma endophyticum]